MPVEVIFPRVDMEMTSGRIAQWHAKDGDTVAEGAPLFEIETDKAAMEIDAPASGTLRLQPLAPDATIPVGAAVAWIVAPGETWSPPSAPPTETRPRAEAPATAPAPAAAPASAPVATETKLLRATPLARREAAQCGLDLAAIVGSGPRGRVRHADVLEALAGRAAAAPPAPSPPTVPLRHGVGLHLERFGPAKGVPVVLLHGFGADLSNWRAVWRLLEAGRPVVAVDLPGHGRSAPAGVRHAELVDAVVAALRQEGIERFHLVGHSLGGAVALGIADMLPGLVRSLGLLAPVGFGPEIDAGFLAGFLAAERAESLLPWLHRLVADPALISDGFLRATLRAQTEPGRRDYQRTLVASLFPDGTQALALRGILDGLAVPAKVIWGQADAIIPARHARGLPPHVAVHLAPGVGHLPHLEAPALVARLIGELAAAGQ